MDLIINLNKPKGITSHQATTEVKKIFKAKKAGHAGTLDPSATGVLLVCLNKATRLASYFSSLDKEYRAVMKLGETTDTQDADGTVIWKKDKIEIDASLIKNTLHLFGGEILQKPPIFSALKYKGKPLYKYAKRGIEITIEPRKVFIHSIELLNIDIPFVGFRVICSKGTYVRTLCNDIGEKLGVGAHLFELERTAIGQFSVSDSLSMEKLKSIDTEHLPQTGIYSMDSALSWMPEMKINESLVRVVKNGNPLEISKCHGFSDDLKTAAGIKIKSPDGEFLALGSFSADKNVVKMDIVFVT